MTKSELQTKVAEVLGVSVSEKELAYDIFISRIADLLAPDLTIKIPGLGFFQLKKTQSGEVSSEIIFSTLDEVIEGEPKHLFLSLELPEEKKAELTTKKDEISDDIFSIGVGKPYIPLSDKLEDNAEASYIFLRKSIEERVNELISEAEHLPNFNFMEENNKILEEQKDVSAQQKLSELTSDLEFEKSIPIENEDFIANHIAKTLLDIEKFDEKISDKNESSSELTPTELLEDYKPQENLDMEKPEEIESKEDDEPKEIEIELGKHRRDNKADRLNIVEDDSWIRSEINIEDKNKEQEDNFEHEKKEESYLGLKKKVPEKIEWNWGDELREELESYNKDFENGSEVEEDFDFYENKSSIKNEKVDDILKTTKPLSSKLFEELEKTIKKEIEETTKELIYSENQYSRKKYEFIEADENQFDRKEISRTHTYDDERKYISQEYGYKNDNKTFGKTFLILFFSFVVIAGMIVYLLLPNKKLGTKNPNLDEGLNLDTSENREQVIASLPQEQTVIPEESDFPRVPVLPSVKKSEQKLEKPKEEIIKPSDETLYRNILNDTRINRTIYFDGKTYNVQVSSWRNKLKAEQEVKRLRREGYDAFVLIANLPEKGGLWYRVRIGSFKSLEEAKEFSSKNNF
ncbi:SPOR domain-containing protein [Ignavibacteria bacterium 4148-Me]|uniref:SPOR domain-containing protein n=1 Tax=Rosettibacter primus TaxID=3111523 RepID=UPI00336C084B